MSNIKASKMIWLKWSNLTKVVIKKYKKMIYKQGKPSRKTSDK